MPCPDKKTVRSYLTPAEHEKISQMATAAGLSVSTFMRKVCLGHEVKTFEHEDFKLELIKTRADLGRVGGLLKFALGLGNQGHGLNVPRINSLMKEINTLRRSLSEAVSRL